MDTIFALATAPGKSGVAVVRLSGPDAFDVARQMSAKPLPTRGMMVSDIHGANGDVLDSGLILTFQSPQSFTGEDVVELHLHGSMAIVSAVLHDLGHRDHLRLAEPGEFTRRAFVNGKMDLTQVEGLADLIEAETEAQRRQASAVFSGKFGELALSWRQRLVRAAALIEATIDFADEDVPVDVTPEVIELLNGVLKELAQQKEGMQAAERIRSGFEVAIVGRPNVGKSTLLNALAGRSAAITSEVAGTTRDVIEVQMDINGLPVTILDTAGIRDTDDRVESLGVELAMARADAADIRVFLLEPGEQEPVTSRDGDIRVAPKADMRSDGATAISGVTGEGVSELIEVLGRVLGDRVAGAGLATRQRHGFALAEGSGAINLALQEVSRGPDRYEFAAEHLRRCVTSLESIVGLVNVEDLLDDVFSSFCIGK